MTSAESIILASASMALLTLLVGGRMIFMLIQEIRRERIPPQTLALSAARSNLLKDSRARDNYNHQFELPVLFYVLCAMALLSGHIPAWLPWGAWLFVASRLLHSLIQCTYNKVMHRFSVFIFGLVLMGGMWVGFVVSIVS